MACQLVGFFALMPDEGIKVSQAIQDVIKKKVL
jgi:hypothetical protein